VSSGTGKANVAEIRACVGKDIAGVSWQVLGPGSRVSGVRSWAFDAILPSSFPRRAESLCAPLGHFFAISAVKSFPLKAS